MPYSRAPSGASSGTSGLGGILFGYLAKAFVLGVFNLGTYWTCYTWLPKVLQNQMGQPVGRSAIWIASAQLGQFLGMMAFGVIADRHGRRAAFTGYSPLTAAAVYASPSTGRSCSPSRRASGR